MSEQGEDRAQRLALLAVVELVLALATLFSLLNGWWIAAVIALVLLGANTAYMVRSNRRSPIWMQQSGDPVSTQKRSNIMSLRPDIAAAKSNMGAFAWKSLREVNKLEDYLRNGEQVRAITAGTYAGGGGIVVLTDKRVLFIKDGWFSKTSQDFRLDRVASVEWRARLFTGTLILFAEGDADGVTIEKVWNRSGKNMRDMLRDSSAQAGFGSPAGYGAPAAAPAPADTRGSSGDIIARLQTLEQMKDTLPPARYEALKEKILNGE